VVVEVGKVVEEVVDVASVVVGLGEVVFDVAGVGFAGLVLVSPAGRQTI